MLDKVYKVYKHILLTCMCSCICYFLICQCMCADMYTHKYTHACSVYVYTYMLYESILVLWLLFSVYLIYSGWIDVIHWFFYTCKKLKQIFKIQIYELFLYFENLETVNLLIFLKETILFLVLHHLEAILHQMEIP